MWWWSMRAATWRSGIFGEMMLTYFKGRGGAGRGDRRLHPRLSQTPRSSTSAIWLRGVTPNFHTQTSLMPFAVNGPIACGGVTVMPGDIIVADDDGAVCVPAALAEAVIAKASVHHDWEEFSRIKLAEGAPLQRYYPLHEDARGEFEAWKTTQPKKG